MLLPLFSEKSIPEAIRISFAFALSFFVAKIIPLDPVILEKATQSTTEFILLGCTELLIGFLIGFATKILFEGITAAGNLLGTWMGFASASSFDPHQESHTDIISKFLWAFAMLLFLSQNAEKSLLSSCILSFKLMPIGSMHLHPSLKETFIQFSSGIFLTAIQIASPIGSLVFLINLGFGILGRAIPQLNSFSLSPLVCAGIGSACLWFCDAEIFLGIQETFSKTPEYIQQILWGLKKK
jgi:flagellar biosynthetic protein FliR